MSGKNFKIGLVVTGDPKGGLKAVQLTDRELERLGKTTRTTGKRAGELRRGVDQLDRSLGLLKTTAAAAIGVLAGGGLVAVGVEALSSAKEVDALARSIGVGADTLGRWQAAADTVNVGSDKMGDIFKDVADKLGDFAATGGGEAKDVIERLNLDVEKLIGLTPDRQLLAIAEGLDQLGTRAEKVFVMEALADDASRLLPLLEHDAAALKAVTAEMDALGVTLDAVELRSMQDANREIDRLKWAAQGIGNETGQALAPLISEYGPMVVEWARDLVGWLDDIGDGIRTGFALDWLRAEFSVWGDDVLGTLEGMIRIIGDWSGKALGFVADFLTKSAEGWVRMPAYARVAFTELYGYVDRFLIYTEKAWGLLGIGAQQGWEAVTHFAESAWDNTKLLAAQAFDYITGSFAALLEKLAGAGNLIDLVPGIDGAEEAIKAAAAGLRGYATTEADVRREMAQSDVAYQTRMDTLGKAKTAVRDYYDAQIDASEQAVAAAHGDLDAALARQAAAKAAAEEKHKAALAAEELAVADGEASARGGELTRSLAAQEEAAKAAAKAQAEYERQLQSLIDRLDPVAAKTRQYKDEIALLDEAMYRGLISFEYHDQLIDRLATAQPEKVKRVSRETAGAAEEEWRRAADTIEQSLTDALMRGFESGEGFGANFVQTMENLFKTLVLRPVISAIVQPAAGAITNTLFGGGGSGTGILNLLSTGSSAYSLFGGGGLFGGLTSAATTAGLYSSVAAPVSEISLAGLSSAAAPVSEIGIGSAGAGIASVLPYLGLAAAGLSLLGGLFSSEPNPRYGIGGPIGDASISGLQDVEAEAVQQFLAQVQQAELAFTALLTDAQIEAIKQADTTIEGMAHVESEHELNSIIIRRVNSGIEQIDYAIAEAVHGAVVDARADGNVSSDELQAILNEIAFPLIQLLNTWDQLAGIFGSNEFDDLLGAADAAGGVQDLLAGVSAYYDLVVSEEERAAIIRSQALDALAEVNDELGLMGGAAIRTAADLRAYVSALDLSTEAGREALAAALEATDALAVIEAQAQQLADLMNGVDDKLAAYTGTETVRQIQKLVTWLDETRASAEALGASTAELARIEALAAYQIQEAIDGLRAEITDLAGQLYGSESTLDTLIEAETQRLSDAQQAADTLYQAEMQRYQDALRAVQSIDDYLAGLAVGSLSPLTPLEQYQAARAEYESTLAAAQAGDATALADVTQRFNAFMTTSQMYNTSSSPYLADYQTGTAALASLAEQLGLVTAPGEPGDYSTSDVLAALEAERQRIIDAQAKAERADLAEQLAGRIGELGLALDDSVWEVMTDMGVDLSVLATDLGLQLGTLDMTLAGGLRDMAQLLHAGYIDLAGHLGVDLSALATSLGTDLGTLDRTLALQLVEAARYTGESIFDLADTLGLDLGALAGSIGVDLSRLGSDMSDNLAYVASVLNVGVGWLSGALGGDLDALAADLGIDADALRAAVNALPPEQRNQLSPLLGDVQTATEQGSASVVSAIYDALVAGGSDALRTWHDIRDGGAYSVTLLEAIRSNLASIASGSGYPSYDIGTAYVPSDQLAQIHRGEIVIDPTSAHVLRQYGIQVHGGAGVEIDLSAIVAELQALRAEVAELRHAGEHQTAQVVAAQRRAGDQTARAMDRQTDAQQVRRRA